MKLQRRSLSANATRNCDKLDNSKRNNRDKGSNAKKVEARGASSLPSSLRTAFQTPAAPTAMPISHQEQTPTLQLYSPPSPTATTDDARFWTVCLAANHQTTQCLVIPEKIRTTLMNTCEASLLILSRRPQWIQPNGNRGGPAP